MNELLSLESKLRFLIMYSTSWETPLSSQLRKIRSFCRQPSVSTSCFSIKIWKKRAANLHDHSLSQVAYWYWEFYEILHFFYDLFFIRLTRYIPSGPQVNILLPSTSMFHHDVQCSSLPSLLSSLLFSHREIVCFLRTNVLYILMGRT